MSNPFYERREISMKNLILDVDTGIDDAFALLFAARHPEINLLGVTCVDGNTSLPKVIKNTMKVLDAAGAGNIPVAAGANRPLIEEPRYAEWVHGADGLGDLGIPDSNRQLDPRPAIILLRDLIEASNEPVTLIPLAPLTNIALFLRAFPETAKKIERIVLMGGSASGGNASATAEFNIWHDPEAAAIVFNSGVQITMYGLDVFMLPIVTQSHADSLMAKSEYCSQFAGKLIGNFIKQIGREVTLGDYGAVLTALKPELSRTESLPVVVDTTFGPNRGQTVVDRRRSLEREEARIPSPRTDVVLDIQTDMYRDIWMETIQG